MEKLKGAMVKKTRSAAGCEKAGSLDLMGAGVRRKKGGSMSLAGAGGWASRATLKAAAGKVKGDPDMRRKVRANIAAMRAGKRQPYGSADDISLVGSGMRVVRGRR